MVYSFINLTAGVNDVQVEKPHKPSGLIPDITLLKSKLNPPTFIEVEVTSPASARKIDYCRQHGIDLYKAYGLAPVTNNAETRLLHLGVETMRCRRKERDSMNDLWAHLHSIPADDDCRFGVLQNGRAVKYIIGTKSASREELCVMCILHSYFIQDMEVRFGDAAVGLNHGEPIRYSPQAIAADNAIMAVSNRIEYQNGPDGPRVPPENAHVLDLSDVFFYPRRWGIAPRLDAYRRA